MGLPDGQMGNSEVGHLNLGAGRPVVQDLPRIDAEIADGSFFDNAALLDAVSRAAQGHRLHLVGLLGPGGVHSVDRHAVGDCQPRAPARCQRTSSSTACSTAATRRRARPTSSCRTSSNASARLTLTRA